MVAASLAEELALLSADGRRVLEGAAVAGDPFEPELAAAAAATSETAAMEAVDELLASSISCGRPRFRGVSASGIRSCAGRSTRQRPPAGGSAPTSGAPRRSRARGAAAATRAHHVERSAREGDVEAVAVLREAGEEAAPRWRRRAPRTGSRTHCACSRETASAEERVELLLARAGALTAAGHFAESHEALLEARGARARGRTRAPSQARANLCRRREPARTARGGRCPAGQRARRACPTRALPRRWP